MCLFIPNRHIKYLRWYTDNNNYTLEQQENGQEAPFCLLVLSLSTEQFNFNTEQLLQAILPAKVEQCITWQGSVVGTPLKPSPAVPKSS